jgi:transcription elongation factor Elf1
MEKIFKCPKCGELSYENVIPAIGRHLLCPYCETKFNFEFKHLIGEGSQYGLSRRYSEAELAKLVSETLVVAKEEPTKEEPAKEEAPAKTHEPEAVTVAVAETPKAETPSAPVAKEELISKPVEKLELSQITINEQRLDCLKPTEIDPGQKLLAQSEIRDNSVLASSEIQPLDTDPSSKECKVPAQPIIEKIR